MRKAPDLTLPKGARLYGRRWDKAAKRHLDRHPLCAYCLKRGVYSSADRVDHIDPHRGDPKLFWDSRNWQSLCSTCHQSIKQKEEAGKVTGCDARGIPLDPNHHWNKGVGGR